MLSDNPYQSPVAECGQEESPLGNLAVAVFCLAVSAYLAWLRQMPGGSSTAGTFWMYATMVMGALNVVSVVRICRRIGQQEFQE